MQKNDLIELTITDLSVEGAGIGKYEGMTFFVKDTVIGDVILAKIMKLKKHYGYARLMDIKEASPNRVEPYCVYARACGGCQLQQMSYESQLAFKEKKIRDNLIRLGGFSKEELDRVMEPIVGMEHPFGYRNKAQFPVGYDREGNVVAGFYAGRTHSIIPNTDCALGVPENRKVLETVLSYMREQRVSAYEETTGKGLVRHVLIRYGFDSREIMVCLVVNGRKLPGEKELAKMLGKIPGMRSISLNVNTKNTNVILGEETRTIWGADTIRDALYLRNVSDFSRTERKTVYQISPQSFYQVNPLQTEKLYSLVLDYAALTGKETVWDLYCGIGTISLFLAANARMVYGVEIVPKAVEDARENARLNGIGNAEFFLGKAEEVLPEFYRRRETEDTNEDMLHPDVMVVDPPRKGCDEKCLDTMIKMRPERIVYVSCDSATLARDLRVLTSGGYEVKRVRGVDQFGETVHVETVVLLSKLKTKQHIKIELRTDELDLTASESKATYQEIKQYVLEKYGFKVSSLNIAQTKTKCGIIERECYRKAKNENAKQPNCTLEKENAIKDAFRHFQMI